VSKELSHKNDYRVLVCDKHQKCTVLRDPSRQINEHLSDLVDHHFHLPPSLSPFHATRVATLHSQQIDGVLEQQSLPRVGRLLFINSVVDVVEQNETEPASLRIAHISQACHNAPRLGVVVLNMRIPV
jgi:hypothetical protein